MNRPNGGEEERFWDLGYTLRHGLLERSELEALRREVQDVFCRQILRLGIASDREAVMSNFEAPMFELYRRAPETYFNCGKQAQHLLSLHRLSLDDRIVAILRLLGIESPCVATRPVLFFHHERTAQEESYWRIPAHQDWSSMQGSADSIVVWLPLTDVSDDLGPLEIIPGSHLGGLRAGTLIAGGFRELSSDAFAPDGAFVPMPMKAGDVLIFSSMLIHRSGNNRTERFRWSCNFRYNNLSELSFIERGYPHAYIYRPVDDTLTPGFDTKAAIEAVRLRRKKCKTPAE